jgi:hypothetical protein
MEGVNCEQGDYLRLMRLVKVARKAMKGIALKYGG